MTKLLYFLPYYLKMLLIKLINRNIKIQNNITLKESICKKKSIIRFGDGEFDLINNKSIGYQNASMNLSVELKKALSLKNENACICIPSSLNPNTKITNRSLNFWLKYSLLNYTFLNENFKNDLFYDSLFTRCHSSYRSQSETIDIFTFMRLHFSNKNILVVEGTKTNFGIGNDFLSLSKSVTRIKGSVKDSYNDADIIEKLIHKHLQNSNVDIIVLAIGPLSKVLIHRFSESLIEYQFLDLGHMDIEYEWFLRNVDKNKKIPIDSKWVNEVSKDDGGL